MSTFERFEDIEAWKEGRKMVKEIRKICKRQNVKRDFGFVDQITRAARSVCANIAEGFESITVMEFITFLGYARRSAGEVRSHLYDALDEEFISNQEFNSLYDQSRKIGCMTAKLIEYLNKIDKSRRRNQST